MASNKENDNFASNEGKPVDAPALIDETPEEALSSAEMAEDAKRAATRKMVTQSFWSLVRHQYKKNRVAVFALYIVYFLFGVAILADVLANDKPLFASYKGTIMFPVFKQYLVDLRIDRW